MESVLTTAIEFHALNMARIVRRSIAPITDDQLLVRILACGVCHRERHVLSGRIPRAFPAVMGHEPIGTVLRVGGRIGDFSVGDIVTGIGNASLATLDTMEAQYAIKLPSVPESIIQGIGEPVVCAVAAANRILTIMPKNIIINGGGYMGSLLAQVLSRKSPHLHLCIVDPRSQHLHQLSKLLPTFGTLELAHRYLRGKADCVVEASGAQTALQGCTSMVRNGGFLALFAHHFVVPNEVASDWHLRGICVLSTVPWASPDLVSDVAEAGKLLRDKPFFYEMDRIQMVSPRELVSMINTKSLGGNKVVLNLAEAPDGFE